MANQGVPKYTAPCQNCNRPVLTQYKPYIRPLCSSCRSDHTEDPGRDLREHFDAIAEELD